MSLAHPKSLIILSGGLDSAVSLAWAKAHIRLKLALTFNYGQRAFPAEFRAASALTEFYNVPHQVIELPWLAGLLPPAMDAQHADALNTLSKAQHWAVKSVWVPNRNGVFLNIAAAIAEAQQLDAVIFGANLDEAEGFPDNTQAYRDVVTQALGFSTLNQVKVLTPVGHLCKADMIQLGESLQLPWHLIWSCYDDGPVHCGYCASCGRLKHAIQASGCHTPALKRLLAELEPSLL